MTVDSDQFNMGQIILALLLTGVMALSGWTLSEVNSLSAQQAVLANRMDWMADSIKASQVDSNVISSIAREVGEARSLANKHETLFTQLWPRNRVQDKNDEILKRAIERAHPGTKVDIDVIKDF